MSEIKSFFRFCPACGRRFHIKLVSKTLTDDKISSTEIKSLRTEMNPAYRVTLDNAPIAGTTIAVEENIPVTVEEKDFQYTYKCKHCGHVWSEAHVEEKKAKTKW
jgi:uncharacterized Zn finger protein